MQLELDSLTDKLRSRREKAKHTLSKQWLERTHMYVYFNKYNNIKNILTRWGKFLVVVAVCLCFYTVI